MKLIMFGCFALLSIATSTHAITYTVTSTADSGAGSLRDAINSVNAATADTIEFAIAPFDGTVKTITPATNLPAIVNPVVINGYTQPGSSVNTAVIGSNAVPLIEIRGGGSVNPAVNTGLVILGGNSVVRGLIINNFLGDFFSAGGIGIFLQSPGNLAIGNFVGLTADGLGVLPCQTGIVIFADGNVVGTPALADRNLIAGSAMGGFAIGVGFSAGCIVQNNYCGSDKSGLVSLANDTGITIFNAANNIIGGLAPFERNVIHGALLGITLNTGTGNTIQGNLIGVNGTGAQAFTENGTGIRFENGNVGNTVDSNVISGCVYGIVMGLDSGGLFPDDTVLNTLITRNKIGTDATGTFAIPNTRSGILMCVAQNNTIGGSQGNGNIISGNALNGIYMAENCANNEISFNFIGTDWSGRKTVPNQRNGIQIGTATAQNNLQTQVLNNIISGNNLNGLSIESGSTQNVVQSNLIGVDIFAQNPLPNSQAGVSILCSSDNIIGA